MEVVTAAYGTEGISFGPEYLIPKPFDTRLIIKIAPAVARAAMDDGVATRPILDMDAYEDRLQEFVYLSGNFMKPILTSARLADKRRIVFAEGEEERVLRAVQVVLDEGLAAPVLIGRPAVIEKRIARFGLRMHAGEDFLVVNPEQDDRYREYWEAYYELTERSGVTAQYAQIEMRRRHTLIGAMMIRKGHADGMICGTFGTHSLHLHYIDQVLGRAAGANVYAAINILILQHRTIAMVDTHVNENPSALELAEITITAAREMRALGLEPRIALLSHSNFGSGNSESARKMREVLQIIRARAPELNIDGEMHGDVALDAELRKALMPRSTLQGDANLLVLPSMESANISYNLLKRAAGNNVAIGPMLMGCAAPVHVLTASATVRRLVNMTAIAVVQANSSSSTGLNRPTRA